MSSVAVKNPETSSLSQTDRFRVGVLVGVVYVLCSLAILFELLPWLWWGPLGFQRFTSTGGLNAGSMAVLVLVGIVIAIGLIYGGLRLLGPEPTPGVKAGIFTTLLLLLLILLLTRWASSYFENWVYDGTIGETLGIILTAVVGGLLLILLLRSVFLKPGFPRKMVGFESAGWFSTSSYKRSQGVRVRRGTILGFLLLIGCGIYALLSHRTLAGAGDWTVAVPFAGQAEIKDLKDARGLYDKANLRPTETITMHLTADDTEEAFDERVRKDFRPEAEQTTDLTVISLPPDSPLGKAGVNLGDTITEVNGDEVKSVSGLIAALKGEGERTVQLTLLRGSGFRVDEKTFRRINNELKDYVRITDRGSSNFYPGQIVKKDPDYETERRRIANLKVASAKEPGIKPADPAVRIPRYTAAIPILPHVQYTLPILLAALALWVGWRIVNVPSFADFLIATEAELNKVSWTTRRRLVQDTIVVLVTVVLFTLFLLVVDVAWGKILSSRIIGVLKWDESARQEKPREQKW
jgi:preprotein translocase SecE subunit